ncbi:putative secreted (periplasmic) protein [Jannaschia seosinensis]|uniref:Putative secreted (Periplasmic) protein n=1 Tax=Jannaschia seosinensis TaxID=313367 RepID=A0A0M7B6V4_9RHOB|nr:cell division protein FtsL [Jannaschia seosinensis]CUH19605.1 putative secreted (periplasmic) protein [Jannaschia seosinensis]
MRAVLYAASIVALVGLAYWAYDQGYETRATEREVAKLERRIGALHQEMSMLRAEWAYLNRPDRLHALAEMNFERLGLMALTPAHYALAEQVGYPPLAPPPPPEAPSAADWADVELGDEVDGVIIMNHVYGANAAPRVITPPTLAGDGEQLP